MKKFLLPTSALVVIAGAHPARAADQSAAPRLPTKTQIVPPAPIYNWTGCYIGVHGGGGTVSDTFVNASFEGNNNFLHGGGGFAGGQIGCNYQNGNFVFGLEGEAWSSLANPLYFILPGDSQNIFTRNRWSADVAVRAGLAFDRALVYGKAGIAEGRFAFSEANIDGDIASGAATLTGVLLGVGLEYGFAPNWSAKLEYDHIEYAGRAVHFDQNVFPGPFNVTEAVSANLVKAGINYRFGGSSLPVAWDGATAHPAIYKALPGKALAAAPFSWTGCYAGVHVGGGWMRDTFVGGDVNGGGGIVGGQVGCNLQAGAIVWGIEGEAAWSSLTDRFHFDGLNQNIVVNEVSDTTTRNRWNADVAARAGLAVDSTLVYGKLGVAAGGFIFSFSQIGPTAAQDGSATLAGLLLGAGIEYALTQNWSVKLEYDHVDYFGRTVGFDTPFLGHLTETDAATTDVLTLGVNYRFGTSGDLPFGPMADRGASAAAIFKAPVYKAPAAASYWTGCYAGLHGGGGLLGDSFPIGGADANPVSESSGGFAGGQLGCDVQTGALVFGLEGEAAWSRIVDRVAISVPSRNTSLEESSDLVWGADVAARAGIAIDRGLLYGKAGVAAGRFEFEESNERTTPFFFDNGSTTLTGLLLGGGIEYALTPNWSVLLEYDRIAYANGVVHFNASGRNPFNESEAATINEARAGINYRFGGAPLPSIASASQRLLPAPATDWTGCYAGVHAGGGIIEDTFVPPLVGVGTRGGGATAGGQAGCNYQAGMMVFGLEGDAAWSNLANRFSLNSGLAMQQASDRNRWTADLAARTGIAFDRALLYSKAGVAAGRFDFFDVDNIHNITGGFLQGGATLTGLLLGLGVEYAFAPNWSAKLEYDHVGYLSRNIDLGTRSTNESATTNTVTAGINYKFFGPSGFFGKSAVVVAKD